MSKYKLEPDENFMEFAGRFGVSVSDIWNDYENRELRLARKNFWYVGSGDEVVVPEELINKRKRMPSGEAKKFIQCPHPSVIDVHIGFMDEEVNARLAKLIEKEGKEEAKKRRPVILIERGKLNIDDSILEWRLGNYPIDGKKNPIRTIVHVSPQGTLEWLEQGKKVQTVKLNTDFGIKWKIWKSRHAWLEEKAEKLTTKEMSLAPETILARAMGVYMEQDVTAEKALGEKGVEYTRAFDIVELLARRKGKETKSKLPQKEGDEGPWLSVVRFDIGPDTYEKEEDIRPPIIFMRTPEMGLQPGLMKPYVEFLFKSISLMASQLAAEKVRLQDPTGKEVTRQVWEWPLKVFQYGAQGSCSLSSMLLPGKQVVVIASLYVGYDIDKNGDVWSVISLCTPAGVYDYLRIMIGVSDSKRDIVDQYMEPKAILEEDQKDKQAWFEDARGKILYSFKSRYEEWPFKGLLIPKAGKPADDLKNKIEFALEIAASIFHTQASDDQWKRLKIVKAHQDPNGPYIDIEKKIGTEEAEDEIWTLKKTIEQIDQLYKDKFSEGPEGPIGVVTGTFSYFGGEKDKDASNKLGIYGANMEDYHILRVLRNAFCQGIWESTNYPMILGWRIDRIQCDPKEIPATVIEKFKAFAKGDKSMLTREGYIKVILWGLRGVLKSDIEANKGLKDTIYWKFPKEIGKMEDIKKYFWSFVKTEDIDKFWVPDPFYVEIATDFVKELSEMKPGIDEFRPGPNITEEQIKRKAKKILEAWKKEQNNALEAILKPDSATYLAVAELMEDLSRCGFEGGAGRMKTWLRPKKWSNAIKKSTLQDAYREFDGAAVDRAFYKSSNVMALQTMAGEFKDVFTPLQV